MKKLKNNTLHGLDGPLLDKIRLDNSQVMNVNEYPFSLSIINNFENIKFPSQVTFFVGENGTGKSTILEAIASKAGFGLEGGSKNINFKTAQEFTYTGIQLLAQYLVLSWRKKPQNGYFFRAESFFNIATYLDQIARDGGDGERAYASYGGKSLHAQSHGESFLSFFKNRLGDAGFFIFDEPEAALSPERQLALMVLIYEKCQNWNAQFIIATHSPILLAYPGATIYSCDGDTLKSIAYTDTKHYKITKQFFDNPDYFLHHLFKSE